MSEPYHLVIKAQARRALEHQLSPSTAFAVWEFIAGPLVENPQRVGKQVCLAAVSGRLVRSARTLPCQVPDRR